MSRHTFDFHLTRLGSNTAVVTLSGDFDAHTCHEVRTMCAAIVEHACSHLVIDASRITFIDSAGLGVLVGAMKRAEARPNGCFELREPSPAVRRALSATGLTGLLRERATVSLP